MGGKMERSGLSYAKRVKEVNDIYDQHIRSGLSNREIWRRYIWPKYAISERTLYYMLKAPAKQKIQQEITQLTLF